MSVRLMPLVAIGLALAFALFGPPIIGTLAPWLVLGCIAAAAVWKARGARRLAAAVESAEEQLRLRNPRQAFHAADALLADLVHEPGPSARCVHVMVRALQQLGHPETCLAATGVLLDRLPPHHPARAAVLLNRAIAEFESDRLADGDATLGRLRAMIDLRGRPIDAAPGHDADERDTLADTGPDADATNIKAEAASTPGGQPDRRSGQPLPAPDRQGLEEAAAAFRVARLIQSVMTWHVADAVEDAREAGGEVAAFRAMGIDAGFAHGLLAWCHLQLNDAEAAGRAWARATLLVPAPALAARFSQLGEVSRSLTAHGGLPT